jgi:hypothetical protein
MRAQAIPKLVLMILVVAAAAACQPSLPTLPGVGPTIPVAIRGLPCSSGTAIGDTELTNPAFFSLVGRYVTGWPSWVSLTWRTSGDCRPNGGYNVYLATDRDTLMASRVGHVTGTSFSTRIQPGQRYYWTAAPVQDGVELPVHDPSSPTHGPGTTPFRWSFFTGPTCDTYSLGAPVGLTPIDGITIDGLQPDMTWEYPSAEAIAAAGSPVACLPDHFILDVSKDPTFAVIDVHYDVPPPAKEVFLDPLDDCSRYYWRVRAIGERGARSPWSDTENFVVDSHGLCTVPPIVTIPPPEIPLLRPIVPLPCRLGPADRYELVRYFNEQQLLPAVARDGDGSWIQVQVEGFPLCWVPWSKVKPQVPSFEPMSLKLGSWPPEPTKVPEGKLGCLIYNKETKDPTDTICRAGPCTGLETPGGTCTR